MWCLDMSMITINIDMYMAHENNKYMSVTATPADDICGRATFFAAMTYYAMGINLI